MWGCDNMWGFGWWMMLIWIVFIVAVIYVVIAIIGKNRGSMRRASASETPLDILKKRYASGEISREEFERIRKDLSS